MLNQIECRMLDLRGCPHFRTTVIVSAERATTEDCPYRSNLSKGETRISEAPAARRRSIDSQKKSSSRAVWTATQPSTARGMMVGALRPGTTARIAGNADSGAFI